VREQSTARDQRAVLLADQVRETATMLADAVCEAGRLGVWCPDEMAGVTVDLEVWEARLRDGYVPASLEPASIVAALAQVDEVPGPIPPEILATIRAQVERDQAGEIITPAMRRQAAFNRELSRWLGVALLVVACAVLVWLVTS
jgi:hypothetical protein